MGSRNVIAVMAAKNIYSPIGSCCLRAVYIFPVACLQGCPPGCDMIFEANLLHQAMSICTIKLDLAPLGKCLQ